MRGVRVVASVCGGALGFGLASCSSASPRVSCVHLPRSRWRAVATLDVGLVALVDLLGYSGASGPSGPGVAPLTAGTQQLT